MPRRICPKVVLLQHFSQSFETMDSQIKKVSEQGSVKSGVDDKSAMSDMVNGTIFLSNNVSLSLTSESLVIRGIP